MNSTPQSAIMSGSETDRRLTQSVREAILLHKRAGNPIAVWRDGKVAIIPADEIILPDEEEAE